VLVLRAVHVQAGALAFLGWLQVLVLGLDVALGAISALLNLIHILPLRDLLPLLPKRTALRREQIALGHRANLGQRGLEALLVVRGGAVPASGVHLSLVLVGAVGSLIMAASVG
jgi:hypothetical protein